MNFAGYADAAFLDEQVDLRADAEVRQATRRVDWKTGAAPVAGPRLPSVLTQGANLKR